MTHHRLILLLALAGVAACGSVHEEGNDHGSADGANARPTFDGGVVEDASIDEPAAKAPQWAQSGFGAAKSGQAPYLGPTKTKLKWLYILDGGWGSEIVVGGDGTVFFTNQREGQQDRLIALASDGSIRWKHEADRLSGPVIAADGSIFVFRNSGKAELVALTNDGGERWSYEVGYPLSGSLVLSPTGTVFFGTSDGADWRSHKARIHAISAAGKELWTTKLTDGGYLSTPALSADVLYVGGDELRAIDVNDGSIKWTTPVQTLAGVFGPAVGPDGTVYVATTDWSLDTTEEALVAIASDGSERWRLTTGLMEMTPAVGSDGTIYFHAWPSPEPNALSSGLFAIDANGKLKWSLKDFMKVDPSDVDVTSPLVGSDSSPIIGKDGVVYMGADSGDLFAIKDGALLWQAPVGFEIDNRPSLGADGTLYACNAGGPGHTKCFALSDSGTMDIPDPWSGHTGGGGDDDPDGGAGAKGCEVSGEYGESCDSADRCSSGEWISGCCIAGTCQ